MIFLNKSALFKKITDSATLIDSNLFHWHYITFGAKLFIIQAYHTLICWDYESSISELISKLRDFALKISQQRKTKLHQHTVKNVKKKKCCKKNKRSCTFSLDHGQSRFSYMKSILVWRRGSGVLETFILTCSKVWDLLI